MILPLTSGDNELSALAGASVAPAKGENNASSPVGFSPLLYLRCWRNAYQFPQSLK